MLHGARLPAIRRANTIGALTGIKAAALLPAEDCDALGAHYRFLRSVSTALRLFGAHPSEVRGSAQLDRLCRSLPPAWSLLPESAPDFVAASTQARLALRDALRLCNRIATSVTSGKRAPLRGGFALIEVDGAAPAGPEELEELSETARKYVGMAGFRRLLALLQ